MKAKRTVSNRHPVPTIGISEYFTEMPFWRREVEELERSWQGKGLSYLMLFRADQGECHPLTLS